VARTDGDVMPIKTTAEALREAQDQLLGSDPNVFIIGEGVNDQGAFGTTKGLKDKFPGRVLEMPVSENGMTGVCIGAAVSGLRPIMIHMRADFLLLAADQIINNAAKWWGMFGGRGGTCPLIIRAIIGRGWGQGLQHSQHLEKMFAEIPGLIVVCPSNAYDAKGLLIWATRQNNPVLFFEHRWIHELKCEVPDEMYEMIPHARVLQHSINLSHPQCRKIQTYGYLVHEAMAAAKHNPYLNVIELMSPIGANWVEKSCCPPSPGLSRGFYPEAHDLCDRIPRHEPHDVPNSEFKGPF
jgi:pyruvate/2-oxoglutarate/acetoin dehydrogenase E1 component